jgi:hypothetical protein
MLLKGKHRVILNEDRCGIGLIFFNELLKKNELIDI